MYPACELIEHCISAKSAGMHGVIALGLPKTPVGKFTETLSAASGCPGSASVKVAVRSGWLPASVLVLLVSKVSIACVAYAGAAAQPRRRSPMTQLKRIRLLTLFSSLNLVASAMVVPRLLPSRPLALGARL